MTALCRTHRLRDEPQSRVVQDVQQCGGRVAWFRRGGSSEGSLAHLCDELLCASFGHDLGQHRRRRKTVRIGDMDGQWVHDDLPRRPPVDRPKSEGRFVAKPPRLASQP